VPVTSNPDDDAIAAYLGRVAQIARDRLDAAFQAIARDIATELQPPWSICGREHKIIANAMQQSFTEAWGDPRGRPRHISREEYAVEDHMLDRMSEISAESSIGIDKAAEVLAAELTGSMKRRFSQKRLAALWRRRHA